ncbi:MAG: glycosyltransferase family 4 protein [Rickettsiaceae bacterium]
MKILFIHPNFPGQFKHLAAHFAKDKNNEVLFICTSRNNVSIPGVKKIISKGAPAKTSNIHSYLVGFEKAVYTSQVIWRICNRLKQDGFTPDVIYAHPGWGDGMLLKDVFPNTPYIAYMEFYYHAFGADLHFYSSQIDHDKVARIRIKNANNLINLSACDWAISPTQWQAKLHPKDFHHKFSVIHEGIDTELLKPNKSNKIIPLPNGKSLNSGEVEIVTYVARNFEPYRGFEQVMYAIEILMKKHPNAHFLMVGGDGVSYGTVLPDGKTYRQKMLEQLDLDQSRLHWYGRLPYKDYINILNYSMAHIYLTIPFVLSWSLLEAMSLACPIVASDTAPVKEVINDGKNGLLVNFFDPQEIADKVSFMLENRKERERLGKNARQTILKRYALNKILPQYEQLIKNIAGGKRDVKLLSTLSLS